MSIIDFKFNNEGYYVYRSHFNDEEMNNITQLLNVEKIVNSSLVNMNDIFLRQKILKLK